MELSGRILQVLPEKNGESARGPWRKQEYILETQGQYPKTVCFMVWGDRIDEMGIHEGQELTVAIDLESREFNGRWYTDVKAWRVTPQGADAAPPSHGGTGNEPPPHSEEDIPF